MDHLLDTCALIFFLQDHARMNEEMKLLIESPGSKSYVSLASLWEIAIKTSLGKLQVAYADRDDLPELLSSNGFHLIDPSWQAMRSSATLPRHHRDPFDRLLVAECQLRNLPIISSDRQLDVYGVRRLW